MELGNRFWVAGVGDIDIAGGSGIDTKNDEVEVIVFFLPRLGMLVLCEF